MKAEKTFNGYKVERFLEDLKIYDNAMCALLSDKDKLVYLEDLIVSYLPNLLKTKDVFGEDFIPSWVWEEKIETMRPEIDNAKHLYKILKNLGKQRKKFFKSFKKKMDEGFLVGSLHTNAMSYYDLAMQKTEANMRIMINDLNNEIGDIFEEIIESLQDKLNETNLNSRNIDDYRIDLNSKNIDDHLIKTNHESR